VVHNFPVVDEHLREIRDDLPYDFYRELPSSRRPTACVSSCESNSTRAENATDVAHVT